jgi:hypothetical protein
MTVDTTVIAYCAVCTRPIIADEPSVAVDAKGFYADFADTDRLAHSKCGKQPAESVESPSSELVVPPEIAEFVPDGLPSTLEPIEVWVERAREAVAGLKIETEEDAQEAAKLLKTFAAEVKRFEENRVALTKPRKDAAEFIKAQFDKAKAPFQQADADLRNRLAAWREAEAEKRREEQRRIDEERQRVEAEARARREAAEKAAREAAALAAEEEGEDADVAAELAADAQREAQQASVVEQAVQSLPTQGPVAAPKLDGFIQREQWEPEVVDFDELPNALPDGTPLKVVDLSALRKWMHAELKENGGVAPVLPGARFEKRPAGTAVRT